MLADRGSVAGSREQLRRGPAPAAPRSGSSGVGGVGSCGLAARATRCGCPVPFGGTAAFVPPRDPLPRRPGLRGDLRSPRHQSFQHRPEVDSPAGQVLRQAAEVALVSRCGITAVVAQHSGCMKGLRNFWGCFVKYATAPWRVSGCPSWGDRRVSQNQPGPWAVRPPEPVRMPDIRPLHKRKRVWVGGLVLLSVGAAFGGGSSSAASPTPRPTVTVTATTLKTAAPAPAVTVTKSASPAPTVTVTRTAKPTSVATHKSSSGSSSTGSGGSTSGGSSSSGGTTDSSGATALCNDGTYSYAAHHQGACSHHGGVAVFYR
ncbi:DUF3761 domain-containing protein [Streptomyces sp. NPDC090493]|uniref:DUF3761 domain-containing protein n=1 Tax=Streptomyces sp. NPDC090493 TaxID=3365964 RepID=UPI0038097DC1